jgi:hypothetical protein
VSRGVPAPGSCAPPVRTISGRKVVVFVILAPLVVASIITAVAFAYRTDKRMNEKPVGAGAGHTGMYNEYGGIGKQKSAPAQPTPAR